MARERTDDSLFELGEARPEAPIIDAEPEAPHLNNDRDAGRERAGVAQPPQQQTAQTSAQTAIQPDVAAYATYDAAAIDAERRQREEEEGRQQAADSAREAQEAQQAEAASAAQAAVDAAPATDPMQAPERDDAADAESES